MLGNTLLIVDDDKDWRIYTAKYFTSQFKYFTHTASTCAEALRLTREVRPDYILLDYHLSDGTAAEVCASIRADIDLKRTIILVMSGDDTREACAYNTCQADHFILKCTRYDIIHDKMLSSKRRVQWERGIVEKGDICLKAAGCMVYLDSKPLMRLSDDRFRLFSLLVEKSPAVVSEMDIAKQVFQSELTQEKGASINMLICRLRRDLGPLADRIRNQRGVGWVYAQNPS